MSGENGFSSKDLQDRLTYLGLDGAAMQALKAIKPIIDREAPRALDKFYVRAQATPETRAFFADTAMIERAKAAQVEHWRRLAAGELDSRSLATSRRIGDTHARIGLPPKWYIASYGIIADHLISATIAEIWPKGALRGGGGTARGVEAGAALSALVRVVLLDVELATSAYMDALNAKRREAEERSADIANEASKAVEACRNAFSELAGRNLNCQIADGLAPRFREMTDDFNKAVSGLRESMAGVSASIESLSTATREIASASQDLSSRTEHEASSIEQSTAALEEVAAQVSKTAEGAQAAQAIVNQAGQEARQSNEVVARAISAMGRIEKSSNDIGKIIGAIDEIAFQTNLLALNAGVEAARAGEAGRGFAVVASEVRGLAQRSAEAAKEIKALVAAATGEVAGGVKLVSATGEALARIGGKVAEMSTVVGEILAAARQQASSLTEIKQAVGELSNATQQNAAMAEESTAAGQSLARETAALSSLVGQFDLGGRAPPRRAPPVAAPSRALSPPARREAPPARPQRVANGGAAADWKEF